MKNSRPINHTGRTDWKYTPAASTDIRQTFKRALRQLEAEKAERETVLAKRRIK